MSSSDVVRDPVRALVVTNEMLQAAKMAYSEHAYKDGGFNPTNESWRAALGAALAQRAEAVAEADREEDAYVIQRTCELLARIAIIVNGPEPPLTRWSYHDLPEKVQALKNAHPVAAQGDGRG